MEIDAFVECIREGYHERIEMTEDFIVIYSVRLGKKRRLVFGVFDKKSVNAWTRPVVCFETLPA